MDIEPHLYHNSIGFIVSCDARIKLTMNSTGNGEEQILSCDGMSADEGWRKRGYGMICKIISIFSFLAWPKSVALKAGKTQHVSELDRAQCNGSPLTLNDYSASPVDGVQCRVGLEGIRHHRVLSPMKKHCTHIKHNSKQVKMKVPTHCHTFASMKGWSSQRTRAAAGAYYRFRTSVKLGRNTIRNRVKYERKKVCKQREKLFYITMDEEMLRISKQYSTEYLKRNVVVFNGGYPGEEKVVKEKGTCWQSCKVQEGGLVICHPPSHDTGMAYQKDGENEASFILLPRECSLRINSDGRALCDAMKEVMKHHNNLKRGKSKQVFSSNNYCCVGSKPRRYAPGIEPGHYKLDSGVSKENWDVIMKAIMRGEHAFDMYAETDVIRRIREARKVVGWETPKATSEKHSSPKTFNGVAFGMNVHLRAHTDQDFTYSVIQAHVDNKDYGLDDDVLCFFCFPSCGIAIPLKAGDFLLINALEYHCVSSRCRGEDDVFCLSCYLKTAVVGGNNNKKKLSALEEECLGEYDSILKQSRTECKRARKK